VTSAGIRLSLTLLAVVAIGCGRSEPPSREETSRGSTVENHRDEPEHPQLPSVVRLTPQVLSNAGIKTVVANEEELPATVDLSGEIAPDPDRLARVVARAQGRIVEVSFREGDWISAGTQMVVVESAELARARATLTAAQARANASRQNARRVTDLGNKRLASAQEVATAEAEAKAAEAEASAARQSLSSYGQAAFQFTNNAARLELKAPIAGFVLKRDAVVGQAVGPDSVIGVLADLNRAYFMARLFEKDLALIQSGEAAEVRLNAYPRQPLQGTVDTVGRQLDPEARTVIARILILGQGSILKVGLFGIARVSVPIPLNEQPRLTVPLSSITQIAGHDVVFVREPDGDFAVHPITVGRTASGRAQIVAGLRVGESVVYEGVFTLKSVVLKSSFGEEED
jgi:membrane fusion protein, heavy metal efflux system